VKPISEMTDKEFEKFLSNIKPHLPIWKQEGASILWRETETFDYGGNKALVTTVQWKDKKNKEHSSVAWVMWL